MRIVVDVLCVRIVFGMRSVIGGTVTRRRNHRRYGLIGWQRAVIVLHDIEGFTHGEIGGMLGIPEGTARSDLHHARAALRKLLQDFRTPDEPDDTQ